MRTVCKSSRDLISGTGRDGHRKLNDATIYFEVGKLPGGDVVFTLDQW